MISLLARRDLSRAFELFDKMKTENVNLRLRDFTPLIVGSAEKGDLEQAHSLVREGTQLGFPPAEESVVAILKAATAKGKWDIGIDTLKMTQNAEKQLTASEMETIRTFFASDRRGLGIWTSTLAGISNAGWCEGCGTCLPKMMLHPGKHAMLLAHLLNDVPKTTASEIRAFQVLGGGLALLEK